MGRRTVLATALGVTGVTALTTALAVSSASPAMEPAPLHRENAPLVSGLDLNGMDRSVSPADSLFEFANAGWQDATDIPADRAEVGTFADLRVRTEDQLRELIDDAQKKPDNDTFRKLGVLYGSCIDTARRDELKATPLNGDFAAIDKLTTPDELVRYLGAMQRFDLSDPIDLEVRQDDRLPTAHVVVAAQGQLTMPDRDYYISDDPKDVQVRDGYRAYVAKMLTLAGRPDADTAAASVLELESKLARLRSNTIQNRDPVAAYNKWTPDVAKASTGLDWDAYLTAVGMGDVDELLIAQPSYFSGLGNMIQTTPMADWKSYLRWHLLSDAAPYLSREFVDARFEFTSKVLGGAERNKELWRQGQDCVNAGMSEALGELYSTAYFSADAKKKLDRIVTNIKAAFKTSIDTLDWMSPATKAEARKKLEKMNVKAGYPYYWRDWSLLEVRPDDLLGNLRRAAELETLRDIRDINRAVNPGDWDIEPQRVNALYDAPRNEVTFPAAILQPPFFDPNADDAVNYGAIGAVIGHEISHAFDDQGRQYDAAGNLRDWWTPADAAAYAAKSKALVARYSGFTALPGTKVNGQLTLGENLADLSGLEVAYKAFQLQQAAPGFAGGGPSPDMDGFTGSQRFFISYARLWRSKQRDMALRQSLRTDTHSPGRFRTDGVVNNLDDYYTTWGVKEGAPAYLPPEQRIKIW